MAQESLLNLNVRNGYEKKCCTSYAKLTIKNQEKMKDKVNAIAAHGITCFVNRQLIYNYPESIFAEHGIMSIEHADFEGVERLSLVTGGEIASTFDHPELVKLGRCELIEEIMIGEDKARVRLLRTVDHSC